MTTLRRRGAGYEDYDAALQGSSRGLGSTKNE